LRIDASQVLSQGGMRVSGTGFSDSLREGDIIRAEVLSNNNGLIEMRTESGHMLKAKLDAKATLMPGDEVELEVSGKDKSLSLVSVSHEEADINETSSRGTTIPVTPDNSLEPYLNKLTSLNMPATKEIARLMQELMAQNPKLSPEEAAFLAANKLTGDESMMKAALALLSSGEKTDAMILKLMDLLSRQDVAQTQTQGSQPANLPSGTLEAVLQNQSHVTLPEAITSQGLQSQNPNAPLLTQAGNHAQLTDLLTMIIKGGALASDAGTQAQSATEQGSTAIITENTSNLQTTNAENVQKFMQNDILKPQTSAATPQEASILTANTAALGEAVSASAATAGAINTEQALAQNQQALQNAETLPGAGNAGKAPENLTGQVRGINAELSSLLSEIPEFRGTPTEALERFSSMLLRIAGESAGAQGGGPEKLEALLDKLFTRVEKGDSDAGAKLKGAREELFARLALIEEAMSRAAPSARAEMLDQVQKLMEHVKVLNNIESFAYMQLPVKFGEDRKAADLYIFKKKGGKKPDPENVNILLALDLENMGHWESLINIRNKDVSLRMEVAGAKEKEHFSENTVLLHEMLAEAGFKLANTEIAYCKEETTPLTALNTLSRYTAGKAGKIDFLF